LIVVFAFAINNMPFVSNVISFLVKRCLVQVAMFTEPESTPIRRSELSVCLALNNDQTEILKSIF